MRQCKEKADKFVERLKNMYHLPFRGTSSSMPAPEQLLPTVQAMKSLSDTPRSLLKINRKLKPGLCKRKVRFVCEYISTHYQGEFKPGGTGRNFLSPSLIICRGFSRKKRE